MARSRHVLEAGYEAVGLVLHTQLPPCGGEGIWQSAFNRTTEKLQKWLGSAHIQSALHPRPKHSLSTWLPMATEGIIQYKVQI